MAKKSKKKQEVDLQKLVQDYWKSILNDRKG